MAELPPDPFFDETSCPIWSCDIKGQHTHENDDENLPINRQSKRKQGMKVPNNYVCPSCRNNECGGCIDVLRSVYSDDPVCRCKRNLHSGEPIHNQIADPMDGSVHGPGAVISADGEVKIDDDFKRRWIEQFGQ